MAPKRRTAAAAAAPEPAAKRARQRGGGAASKAPAAAAAAARKGGAGAGAAAATADTERAAGSERAFFLCKSEPDVFSIDDLAGRPDQTEPWDGVRSHQAKKVLQSMRLGDQAFFYHSNAKPPGIVGIVEVVGEAEPDASQFDPGSEYYDAKSSRDAPRWVQVRVRLVRRLARQLSLEELKRHSGGALADMALFKYGRLSVQPVTPAQWDFVLGLEGGEGGA